MSTKENILKILLENSYKYISGQELAQNLNITRNSVWKAIESLKNDGHNILAIRNKGYKIEKNNDIVSKAGIENYIENKTFFDIEVFDEIDSTNTLLKKYASEGVLEGKVVVSKYQSAGRGRFQRSFYSPSDTGIYFSLLLRPNSDDEKINLLTTIAAISVCRAIKKTLDKKAEIKWVNDIFIADRKVCGILTEATFSLENSQIESVIVGIGVNVYKPKEDFPLDIQKTAGYILKNEEENARNKIVAQTLNEFIKIFTEADKTEISKEYKDLSFIIERDVYVLKNNEKCKAKVLDINDDNRLVVKYENDKIEMLNSGEISIKLD